MEIFIAISEFGIATGITTKEARAELKHTRSNYRS